MPVTGFLNTGLTDFVVNVENESRWTLTLNLLEHEEWSDERQPGDDERMVALLHWLESVRIGGDPVVLTSQSQSDYTVGIANRTFETRWINTSTYHQFRWAITGWSFNSVDITFFRADTEFSSNPSIYLSSNYRLRQVLMAYTVDVPTTAARQKTPTGSPSSPVYGAGLILRENHLIHMGPHGHLLQEGMDEDERPYTTVVGGGRSYNYTWLPPVQGSSTIRWMASPFNVDAIHYYLDSARKLRLPNPQDIVAVQGADFPFVIHNRSTSGTLDIEDYHQRNIVTLKSGEKAHLRMTWDSLGDGEITDDLAILRRLAVSGDNVGDFYDVGYFLDGSTYPVRPIPIPTSSTDRRIITLDEDAFEFGDAALVDGETRTNQDLALPQAVRMRKAGNLRYELSVGIRTYQASGSISTGHGPRLYIQTGPQDVTTTTKRTLRAIPFPIMYNNDSRGWELYWEGRVEIGDIILPGFQYNINTSMSLGNVLIASYDLGMSLEQTVRVES